VSSVQRVDRAAGGAGHPQLSCTIQRRTFPSCTDELNDGEQRLALEIADFPDTENVLQSSLGGIFKSAKSVFRLPSATQILMPAQTGDYPGLLPRRHRGRGRKLEIGMAKWRAVTYDPIVKTILWLTLLLLMLPSLRRSRLLHPG
jgi:hypothetical protein